jgi:REP element-mobilizing transposase RayT
MPDKKTMLVLHKGQTPPRYIASSSNIVWTRGYLHHVIPVETPVFITFRLDDSLPADVLKEIKLMHQDDIVKQRHEVEKELDKSYGSCCLRDERCAEIVKNALLHFDQKRYRLFSWVVMPNHVHVLLESGKGESLDKIIHSWKSFTAKAINRLLDRTGTLWQREYFDRFIRTQKHFDSVSLYIENNPVKAGLVKEARAWRWSSAYQEAI